MNFSSISCANQVWLQIVISKGSNWTQTSINDSSVKADDVSLLPIAVYRLLMFNKGTTRSRDSGPFGFGP